MQESNGDDALKDSFFLNACKDASGLCGVLSASLLLFGTVDLVPLRARETRRCRSSDSAPLGVLLFYISKQAGALRSMLSNMEDPDG
jgi:hypothetical protein